MSLECAQDIENLLEGAKNIERNFIEVGLQKYRG
jgi:hypothetical protein